MIPTGAVVVILILFACAAGVWHCVRTLRARRLAAREKKPVWLGVDWGRRPDRTVIIQAHIIQENRLKERPFCPKAGQYIDWDRALKELPRNADGGEG